MQLEQQRVSFAGLRALWSIDGARGAPAALASRAAVARHFADAARLKHAAAAYFLRPALVGGDAVVSEADAAADPERQYSTLWSDSRSTACAQGRLVGVSAAAAQGRWETARAAVVSTAKHRRLRAAAANICDYTGHAMDALPICGRQLMV